MRDELIERIRPFCDRYGDKFLELMDICRVTNLRDVPDQDGLYFLKKTRKGRFQLTRLDRAYQAFALQAAMDLCYSPEVCDRIREAKTGNEVTRIMNSARNSDREDQQERRTDNV